MPNRCFPAGALRTLELRHGQDSGGMVDSSLEQLFWCNSVKSVFFGHRAMAEAKWEPQGCRARVSLT